MLVIVRVGISKEKKSGTVIHFTSDNQDIFWNYIIDNQPDWETHGLKILYITHRHLKNEISLIIKIKDQQKLSRFLLEKLVPLPYVQGFWIVNLFEPRLFNPPDKALQSLSRFTLNISSEPKYYEHIYQSISKMLPNNNFMISYLAYTFHNFRSDIIVSILCTGSSTLNKIVNKYIKPIEGVTDIEITRITKTKKLATSEEWQAYAGSLYTPSEGLTIDEQTALEEDMMSGC